MKNFDLEHLSINKIEIVDAGLLINGTYFYDGSFKTFVKVIGSSIHGGNLNVSMSHVKVIKSAPVIKSARSIKATRSIKVTKSVAPTKNEP